MGVDSFICKLCNEPYNGEDPNGIRKHVSTSHIKEDNNSVCEICEKAFFDKKGVVRHILHSHLEYRPHKCGLCGIEFSRQDRLRRHVATIHKIGDMDAHAKCELCSREFSRQDHLRRHMLHKHKDEIMAEPFDVLPLNQEPVDTNNIITKASLKQFPPKSTARSPIKNKTRKKSAPQISELMQNCVLILEPCNEETGSHSSGKGTSRTKTTLVSKKKAAAPKKVSPKKLVNGRGNLVLDNKEELMEDSSQCILCKEFYPGQGYTAMTKHIHNKHVTFNKNILKCEGCGKKFMDKRGLVRHILQFHFKYLPYKCEPCNRSIARRDHYIMHMKTKHKGVIIEQQEDLLEHKKVQTNKRKRVDIKKEYEDVIDETEHIKVEIKEEYYDRVEHEEFEPNKKRPNNIGLKTKYNIVKIEQEVVNFGADNEALTDDDDDDDDEEQNSKNRKPNAIKTKGVKIEEDKNKPKSKKTKALMKESVRAKAASIRNTTQEKPTYSSTNSENDISSRDDGIPFKCIICQGQLESRSFLSKHLYSHHVSNLLCELCGNPYADKKGLVRHLTNIHFRIKPFSCPSCNKTFARAEHQRRHIIQHHPDLQTPPLLRFSRNHDRTVLTVGFPCENCDEQFEKEDVRDEHQMKCLPSEPKLGVERILDKREVNGKIEYLIKWHGFDDSESTWESEECITGASRNQEDEDDEEEKYLQEDEDEEEGEKDQDSDEESMIETQDGSDVVGYDVNEELLYPQVDI
ncbi:hypothetical protein WDU94_000063 [Cyamophila willieti]